MRDHKDAPGNSNGFLGQGGNVAVLWELQAFLRNLYFTIVILLSAIAVGLSGNTWFVLYYDCMLECLGFQALSLSLSHSLSLSLTPLSTPNPPLSTTVSLSVSILLLFYVCVVFTAQCYVQNGLVFFVWSIMASCHTHEQIVGINYISLPPSEL